ncbi:hypothetical protein HYX06_02860 [Candidatus Woesearchaeota archaeon]|nr:hypothetical protein [Candidatus Woesearchaeota archaeon]
MKKKILYLAIFILVIGIAAADTEDFAEAKQIIDAKTPCSKLSEPQLEALGDYFMEQMHPGEAHEAMDKIMGGEGSESLRLTHISMAKRLYCNDVNDAVNYGIVGYGMMGNYGKANYGGMMNMMAYNFGYGMMGQNGYGYFAFFNFLAVLLAIGLVILVYLWIFRLWRDLSKKSR